MATVQWDVSLDDTETTGNEQLAQGTCLPVYSWNNQVQVPVPWAGAAGITGRLGRCVELQATHAAEWANHHQRFHTTPFHETLHQSAYAPEMFDD